MANIVGRFKVNRIFERKDKFTDIGLSFATKKRNQDGSDEFVWSNISARLISTAHQAFQGLGQDEWIVLAERDAQFTNEPYDGKDGRRVWNNPRLLVFNFTLSEGSGGGRDMSQSLLGGNGGGGSAGDNLPPEDDIPF